MARRRRSGFHPIATIVAALLVSGCGGPQSEFERAAVRGKVTLDGQPVPKGQITFFPQKGVKGTPAGAPIEAGEYSIEAAEGPSVGMNRVEIRAPKPTGRMLSGAGAVEGDFAPDAKVEIPEIVESVPARYNNQSELEREVTAGQENQIDFELTTK